jgi:hypothetical protein
LYAKSSHAQAANAPVVPLAMQESLPIPDPASVPLIPIAIVSNLAGRSTLHSTNADGKKSEEVEVLCRHKKWTCCIYISVRDRTCTV